MNNPVTHIQQPIVTSPLKTRSADVDLLFSAEIAEDGLLYDRITGCPATYAAAGARTYIEKDDTIRTAPANAPRIGANGLLCEPAETNLLEYIDDLDSSYWSKTSGGIPCVLIGDSIQAAGLTLQAVIEAENSEEHKFYKSGALPDAGTYFLAAPIKANGRSEARIFAWNSADGGFASHFDLTTGQPWGSNTDAEGMIALDDGVFLCWIIVTVSDASSWTLVVENGEHTGTYAGDGVSGLYVGQPQCIEGAAVQSLILGSGAGTTSRVSDMGAATWPFAKLHPNLATLLSGTDDCTVIVECTPGFSGAPSAEVNIWSSSGVSRYNGLYFRTVDGRFSWGDSTPTYFGLTGSNGFVSGVRCASALVRSSSQGLVGVNTGGSWVFDTANNINALAIGISFSFGQTVGGVLPFYVSRLCIYNRALSTTEIEGRYM